MKVREATWRLSVLAILMSISVPAVSCIDHLYRYQSFIKPKNKVPIEISEEYHHNLRHRRDSNKGLKSVNDTFEYYHTQYSSNGKDKYWLELSNNADAVKDDYLSGGSLRSKIFQLKFTFPYYGHPVTNLSITTGGFLYVGYVETSLKMKVMYVAPLMAFFNTSINASSAIYHFSNASQFTAQWTNVQLQNAPKVGQFTFQCTLYKDGRIAFAYKTLPVPAKKIPEVKEHHVKVGISDAFIGYKWWFIKGMLRKVRIFYIYHSVDYKMDNIKTGSSLLLTPLKNCVIAKGCSQCINLTSQTSFSCAWCPKLNRCSDGLDRHRIEWIEKSCITQSIQKSDKCDSKMNVISNTKDKDNRMSGATIGAIIAIPMVLIIVVAIGGWCFYAYTHPVSRSGLFLIDLQRKPGELFRRANSAAASATTGATTDASKA